MVNIFELFEHEVACDMAYVESAVATAKYEMLSDPEVFMEAGASGNIFQRLIAKVKEIVEKAINTIRQFFSSKQVESNMKKAEAAAKANPGLLKKKVKVKDYEKLDKINKKAQADLKKCKTKAQVDDVMEKYRKQRNIAIGAGAVAVVTLGACFAFSKKKGKENEAKLNKELAETQSLIKKLEDEKSEILAVQKIKNAELEEKLAEAQASVELLSDSSKDTVSRNRELAFKWMKFGATMEKISQARREHPKLTKSYDTALFGDFPEEEVLLRDRAIDDNFDRFQALQDIASDKFEELKGGVGLKEKYLNYYSMRS